MKFLNPEEYSTDMKELCDLLDNKKIKYKLIQHPNYNEEVKKLIGYSPAGEWQILISNYSIIRCMASFGDYEICKLTGKNSLDDNEEEIFRFEQPQELIDYLEFKGVI
jgi:hypothetical protein